MILYKQYIVYKVSFPNNKCYIGITSKDLKERKRLHLSEAKKSNFKFHNALNKYLGQESWDIIDNSATDWGTVCGLEKWYIEFFDSFNNGYNMTLGGDGNLGHKHSKEAKEKMQGNRPQTSKALKGVPKSEEHKINLSIARTGFKLSDETKNKISKFQKNYKSDINVRNAYAISGGGRAFKVYKCICIQKPTRQQPALYKKLEFIGEWISQRQCARDLKLDQSSIKDCLKHPEKHKQIKGFMFEYAKENSCP